MVRITTTLMRNRLKALGSPRKVGYETKDGYGTLHFSKDLRIAIIHPHEIIEVPETIEVVINKTTINLKNR